MQTSRLPARSNAMPERMAADMREDFRALVIGSEEADDVAMPRAAIEIVIAVEDDVFRPFDLAKPDDFDRAQPIVQAIRRARSRRRWRFRRLEIGGET